MASRKVHPSLAGLQILGRARDVTLDPGPTPQERLRALNAKIEAKQAEKLKASEELGRKWAANAAKSKARMAELERESAAKQAAFDLDRKRRPWRYWFPPGGGGGSGPSTQWPLQLAILLSLSLYGLGALFLVIKLAGKVFGLDLPLYLQ